MVYLQGEMCKAAYGYRKHLVASEQVTPLLSNTHKAFVSDVQEAFVRMEISKLIINHVMGAFRGWLQVLLCKV